MAVRTRSKILYLDFRCYLPDGRRVRCVESTGLRDTPRNREIARAKDKAIQYELRYGRFEYLRFFPTGAKAKHFKRPASSVVLSEWWPQWLDSLSVRPNSLKGRISRYEVHIGPHFGHIPIAEIDDIAIQIFRKRLEAQRLKPSYVNIIIKTLCAALIYAHRRGLLGENPCDGIKRLAEALPDIDPFTVEELHHFLSTLPPDWHDMIFVWSRTGLRPGELCALKWCHVDYFNGKLLVRETRNNSGMEGPPKTRESIREVDLRPPAIEALRRQEARTGLMGGHIWLNSVGKPWVPALLRQRFTHLLRLAKLKYRSPKQMRHTFATLAIAYGENITWVSKMLGHKHMLVTAERYNRFIPNVTRDDGSALEKGLNGRTHKKPAKAGEEGDDGNSKSMASDRP